MRSLKTLATLNQSLISSDNSTLLSVIGDDLTYGIAGGRSLAYIDASRVTSSRQDIDTWFFSEKDLNAAIYRLDNYWKRTQKKKQSITDFDVTAGLSRQVGRISSKNAITYRVDSKLVQVILNVYESPLSTLSSFDINVSKSMFLYVKSRPVEIIRTGDFDAGLKTNELHIEHIRDISLLRLKKYVTRGFYISDNAIEKLLSFDSVLYDSMAELWSKDQERYNDMYAIL